MSGRGLVASVCVASSVAATSVQLYALQPLTGAATFAVVFCGFAIGRKHVTHWPVVLPLAIVATLVFISVAYEVLGVADAFRDGSEGYLTPLIFAPLSVLFALSAGGAGSAWRRARDRQERSNYRTTDS